MNKHLLIAFFCCFSLVSLTFFAHNAHAQRLELPEPNKSGGMPLMEALSKRHTQRSMSDEALSHQDIANILWAAWGINREDGKRTIPTGRNKQNAAVYVIMEGGIWIYNAENNLIHRILEKDMSDIVGASFVLALAAENTEYGKFHVGSMYQNVGLYCASAGLANVVKASGAKKVQEIMAPYLPTNYTVMILQEVGKPQ